MLKLGRRASYATSVEAEDAQAIIRLMTLSLQDVGIDSTTGKIDIDVIMTGKPKSLRDKMQVVLSTFADLEKQLGIVEDSTLYQALSRKVDLTDDEARRLIDQLVKEGILYSPKTRPPEANCSLERSLELASRRTSYSRLSKGSGRQSGLRNPIPAARRRD